MNFSPSFVVHIIVFLSSTVSPPILCFVKCSCFFLSHCRYTDLLASRRNVALSDSSAQRSPVYLASFWRSVALSGLILFLILILLLILILILVGSHQSHLPSSSFCLIFLYALLHSSLPNDAQFRFLSRRSLESICYCRSLSSLAFTSLNSCCRASMPPSFVQFSNALSLGCILQVTSLKAPEELLRQ